MDGFKSLNLTRWRQFENINLEFRSNLCVLTGRNGCGKTTILNILGQHFGWNIQFVSTPFMGKRKQKKLWNDVWGSIRNNNELNDGDKKVGELIYDSGNKCDLFVPSDMNNPQYQLRYSNQQNVFGINIPSHRTVAKYNQIDNIPTNPKSNQQQFEEYQQLLLQAYGSGNSRKNPGIVLKESLISLAVFGYGNDYVRPNIDYIKLFERFQEILKIILPKEIGFEKIEINMPDIILITKSGSFNLDAMSGGITDLFSIVWQIHMFGTDKENCTILIDEPENHLHPSMQREFLPGLKLAFPNFKFIVATHSPFILASLPDAQVYALTFNANSRITSTELKETDLTGSANKILRDILDVPNTMPVWVEDKVRNILQQYLQNEYDEDNAKAAFNALKELGLNETLKDFKL